MNNARDGSIEDIIVQPTVGKLEQFRQETSLPNALHLIIIIENKQSETCLIHNQTFLEKSCERTETDLLESSLRWPEPHK